MPYEEQYYQNIEVEEKNQEYPTCNDNTKVGICLGLSFLTLIVIIGLTF